MILFAMLLGIRGGAIGDKIEGYTIVGELIQIGNKQILIGHTNIDGINTKIQSLKKSYRQHNINKIINDIKDLNFKPGIDINKYKSNDVLLQDLYILKHIKNSDDIIVCESLEIKELFDYKKVIDYNEGVYHRHTFDVIKIGNIIISFKSYKTFYFDDNFTNNKNEIIGEIEKHKNDKQIRYWNVLPELQKVIKNKFEKEYLSVPYIIETGRSLFGVCYAATSKNIVILGEQHMKYREIYNKINRYDEGLLQEMPNYIKELNAEMHRQGKMATFYVELFLTETPNYVNPQSSHNLTAIIKTFDNNKFTNLKLRYLDIRFDQIDEQDRIYELFPKKYIKNIFHALAFSEDLALDLEKIYINENDQNAIKKMFSVEHPLKEETPYKKYIREHPFLTRTAYEFMRLRSSDQQTYNKIKNCYGKIITNKVLSSVTNFYARHTDMYLMARILRKKESHLVIYGGANHSQTYTDLFRSCFGVQFHEYENDTHDVQIADLNELLFKSNIDECRIL